jgi:hypothetical protein
MRRRSDHREPQQQAHFRSLSPSWRRKSFWADWVGLGSVASTGVGWGLARKGGCMGRWHRAVVDGAFGLRAQAGTYTRDCPGIVRQRRVRAVWLA